MDRIQSHTAEHIVDDSRVFKQNHDGVGPKNEVHPHGNHDKHDKNALSRSFGLRKEVRQRITDDKADGSSQHSIVDGTENGVSVMAESPHVVPGKGAIRTCKGIVDDYEERDNNKEDHPDGIGCRESRSIFQRTPPLSSSSSISVRSTEASEM